MLSSIHHIKTTRYSIPLQCNTRSYTVLSTPQNAIHIQIPNCTAIHFHHLKLLYAAIATPGSVLRPSRDQSSSLGASRPLFVHAR